MRASPVVALIVFLLPGCGAVNNSGAPPAPQPVTPNPPATGMPAPGGSFPLTLRDDAGREVTFAAPPQRIVSLAPSHTEAVYALGAGERVIAADTYSDYPSEARQKAILNCWPKPPLEKIVSLRPDLVLLFTEGAPVVQQMEALKLPVVKLFPESLEQTYTTLLRLGQLLGRSGPAEQVVAEMRGRVAAVQERVRGATPPAVLFELDALDPARPFVAGGSGFYGELLTLAGTRNLFADLKQPAGPVRAEQILSRNPEILFLGDTASPISPQSPDTVRRRPGWNTLKAVRAGRVYPVQSVRLTRASPRLVEGLEEIARLAHPERFR